LKRPFPSPSFRKYCGMSETRLFELFFDDKIIRHSIAEMDKYCIKKSFPLLDTNVEEFKVFLAILIVSGYNCLPRKHLYWTQSPDVFLC